jgi:hypothetical protein
MVFGRTAEVLERSADLADEHAQRCERLGRFDAVVRERGAAERARGGASRARLTAVSQEELLRELDELERRADARDRVADELKTRFEDDRAPGSSGA